MGVVVDEGAGVVVPCVSGTLKAVVSFQLSIDANFHFQHDAKSVSK